MVVKKSHIISAAILIMMSVPAVYSDTNNNLVQLDLKRSSADSVDVTLVTSENYNDNVLVRKKSDNKYVILIPKVQSSGYSASNLGSVRDLVSNVDVKTVDDTSGGYTKVTLITTKPLDIKTRTTKIKPATSEQKEYNTLIAQANAIKNTVSEAPKLREQKTEVTVDKAPKTTTQNNKEVKVQNKKPDIKLAEITPDKIEKQNKKSNLKQIIRETKLEKELEQVPDITPSAPEPVISENVKDIKNIPTQTEKSSKNNIKSAFSQLIHKIPSGLPKTAGIIALLLATFYLISGLIKKNKTILDVKPSYPEISEDTSFNDITDNNGLSWKEKYQLYLDKSEPVSRGDDKGNYSFIKTPSKDTIEAKRRELERLVTQPDDIEIVEDVYSEDSAISKAIKFKAFENNAQSLNMSKRHEIKSRFKKYEVEIPLQEQKTINFKDSPLSSNPRSLKGANLKVSDVDSRRIKYQPKDYIMSSVDEYLNIIDSEQKAVETPKTTASMKENSYMKGTIVKSGYKISPNKGFYLINKDGQNKLIGKVNDNVIVLKNFDNNVTPSIQVRHDNANVYMVKADGFKSLVEVNDDNMGVLIEL